MHKIIANRFGPPDVLEWIEEPTPTPKPDEVLIEIQSIGMNHADLMAREGKYRLLSGEPPFTPGIEAGGIIREVGDQVINRLVGQRITLGADAPRSRKYSGGGLNGTYASHICMAADQTVPVPESLPDKQTGALWLTYLTAWGCLIWKQDLQPGQVVGIPAASSGVGMAAAQIAKQHGAITIGLTTRQTKADTLSTMPEADFDHIVVTRQPEGGDVKWHKDILEITEGHGIDVWFDPVAAGNFLSKEIRCMARGGTIWIYGLLEPSGNVDLSPLIIKRGTVRGWLLYDVIEAGPEVLNRGYEAIIQGFTNGAYRQRIAETFALSDAQNAHSIMENGQHIGKLILRP